METAHSDATIRTPSTGFAAAQLALRISAYAVGSAPSSDSTPNGGGCISDISSDAIHGCAQDYTAAMKNYGDIYEQYQAYLLPDNQLQPHNYDLAAAPVPAFNHLGCLNEDLLESTAPSDIVSDDDIESCGYLGWLYH